MQLLNYEPTPTCRAFHDCNKKVKLLCGPYGSGKSFSSAIDLLGYAVEQPAAPDGIRYSRIGIVRATYPELVGATRKSLAEVFPEDCGSITDSIGSPPRGQYFIPLDDGTAAHVELELVAIKTEADCKKLLSKNWTCAWINEATGVDSAVLGQVLGRIGRYPSQTLGGIHWGGVIMDFNQPENGSWLDIAMKNPASNWGVFIQPPAAFKIENSNRTVSYAVNPNAENLRNLGSWEEGDPDLTQLSHFELQTYLHMKGMRYYQEQIAHHVQQGREDIVQNQFCMLDVPIIDGMPVYSGFDKERHVAPEAIEPEMFTDIILGVDQSGVHPAAVVLQMQRGRWCVLDEICLIGEGLETFLYGALIPLLRSKYSTNPVSAAIDPSNTRDSWQAVTPKQRFEEAGIKAVTEITNSTRPRIQTVEHMLNKTVGGLYISPTCELLIRGFTHEYRYKRLGGRTSSGAAYMPTPDKTADASHPHDALQYAALLIQKGAEENGPEVDRLAQQLAERRSVLTSVV